MLPQIFGDAGFHHRGIYPGLFGLTSREEALWYLKAHGNSSPDYLVTGGGPEMPDGIKKPFSSPAQNTIAGKLPMSETKIPPHEAISMLNGRLDAMTELSKKGCDVGYYDLLRWCSKTWNVIDEIYGPGNFRAEEIRQIGVPPCSCAKPGGTPLQMEVYSSQLQKYISEIEAGLPVNP